MIAKALTAQSLKVRRDLTKEAAARRLFQTLCEQQGLPRPETEYQFLKTRRFRFDYAWIKERVALEVVGGVWVRGGHSRGKIQLRDMERRNLAQLAGWKVLEVPPAALFQSDTLDMLRQALQLRNV